jgi:hypothetical protein
MVVEKRNFVVKNIQKNLSKFLLGEMAERFKAVDCKSIEFLIVGSNPTFSFLFLSKKINSKYGAVGSAPVLGTGGHVFKSHYFEIIFF